MDLHKYSKVEERIIRALDDETEFEFVDLPLTDVVEYLKQQHNIQIILDEQALLDEGIQPDEPINWSVSGISLRSALKIILEPLALTYVIQDEVPYIAPRARDWFRWAGVVTEFQDQLQSPRSEPSAKKTTASWGSRTF